jgi:Eco57I restriction-modification methylase/restriction endonuclease TaqI-like protein
MNQLEAKNLIRDTFQNPFDEQRFRLFAKNLFNDLDESKAFSYQGQYIPDAYKDHVRQYKRLGKYIDPEGAALDVLVVSLKRGTALDRARTMQRNFIAWYLKHRGEKDAAIVAYHTDGLDDWRFSYVRMDYQAEQDESGKVRVKTDLTPARRYSFLVGKNEPNHTAQQQLLPIVQDDRNNPTLAELEKSFNIESVTKEFFERYKNLFLKVKEELDELVEKDRRIREDFTAKEINTADFAKKLLGQIVFLYFLQKKGWLGVVKDESGTFKGWGSGPKDFLQRLYCKDIVPYANFFNDLLEPLFYEALAIDRGEESYYSPFKCKIPFLNGGLFEPISGYNWQETDILIRNETFGEIFDTFDLYNFTVREDEPLDKEVAVDPEMLGKVFENLLEVKDRKSKGAYYTPREIVHYMCQESLINYIDGTLNASAIGYERLDSQQSELFGSNEITKPKGQMELMAKSGQVPVPREDIELFIRQGEFGIENDLAKEQGTKSYSWQLPESIRTAAWRIDEALADIKICDPAIGSGAFPVGMLHEIVSARKTLNAYLGEDTERTPYNFKRHAIQQSIYGVDVDCGAVDIAKLRLWLSLVVDEEDFHSIKPLPNLDYKIVCGDSLVGVERNLLNNHYFKDLELLKNVFFDETNPRQKKDEKVKIDDLIKLLTNNDKHFDYEIYFSEVYHKKGGFDIVIGNPPYLGFQGIDKDYKKILSVKFNSAKGKFDLYIIFIEKSYSILNKSGYFIFICPTAFTKRDHGLEIRKFLLDNVRLDSLIDFEHDQLFENATNYTGIFSYNKTKTANNFLSYKNSLLGNCRLIAQDKLNSSPWIFTDDASAQINDKLNKNITLAEIAFISEGVVTGLNTLFLQTKENIIRNNFEDTFFKSCYRGKDIEKYNLKINSEFLFYPYVLNNGKTVPISESELEAKCPIYLRYLRENLPLIMRRDYFTKSSKKWYELWNQRSLNNFVVDKIITPELSDKNRFMIAPLNTFYGDTVCGLTLKDKYRSSISLKYLLAVLNSTLIEWYYKKTTVPKAGGFFIYKVMFLKTIPIKIASHDDQVYIETLVDDLLNCNSIGYENERSSIEKSINDKIMRIYGLSEVEATNVII